MAQNSKIEWCDHTFNPWIGCTKVSPGCANCYAEDLMHNRYGRVNWGKGNPRSRTSESNWKQPLKWNRQAKKAGTRFRVFCASLGDLLDPEVPIDWLADLLYLIRQTPHLDWLLLTKRPELWKERIFDVYEYLRGQDKFLEQMRWLHIWMNGSYPVNVWMGASVETQHYAHQRISALLRIPANVRFLSCEPLLGSVDLEIQTEAFYDAGMPVSWQRHDGIHWVIVGGESGKNARPMHPNWVRSLRDQCIGAKVPFFFKQWGEWSPPTDDFYNYKLGSVHRGHILFDGDFKSNGFATSIGGANLVKVGKKKAGRLLDGREWNEFPLIHAN